MRYLSVCSGIEAATMAWKPLGWEAAAFSEIEAFPRAVLAHHYPHVPLHGDFTTIQGDEYGSVDLLVGGTPCQSFSVSGLRGGLDDDRGNLALEFLKLARRTRARWLVWENVPGVLSSNEGRDFGSIIGGMVELGYGIAYRTLDAQYFGLAQRRRRVFVVGYLGDWRRAGAVLFERESLRRDSPTLRKAGQDIAGTLTVCTSGGGGPGASTDGACAGYLQPVAKTLVAGANKQDPEVETLLPVPYRTSGNCGAWATGEKVDALTTGTDPNAHVLALPSAVRRLTPTECERLMGFPDDYTRIPYRNKPADKCPDSPRYRALGNSMAVPVMRWIGERIAAVEAFDTSGPRHIGDVVPSVLADIERRMERGVEAAE